MNATVLLLSSALLAGADPVPAAAAPPVAAPVVTAAPIAGVPSGCGGCSAPAPCAPSCEKAGLLDRLRARLASFHKPKCHTACAPACTPAPAPCCAPAPTPAPCCGTPVFTGFTTSCADPCDKGGLLARLRAKFHGSKHCDACSAPHTACTVGCGAIPTGCAPAVGTVLPANPTPAAPPPPDAMPKPNTPK